MTSAPMRVSARTSAGNARVGRPMVTRLRAPVDPRGKPVPPPGFDDPRRVATRRALRAHRALLNLRGPHVSEPVYPLSRVTPSTVAPDSHDHRPRGSAVAARTSSEDRT